MSSVVAGIFKSRETLEEFREAVIALDSSFPLEKEDLLELGQAYCDRYPETYSKRNPQHVQIGYTMARICVIEKALDGTDPKIKKIYRSMFYTLNAIEEKIVGLIQVDGCEQVHGDYQRIFSRIKHIEGLIDELPRGMIKEKFIGGLSVIYNVVYLINHFVEKCMQELKRS
jgi:hypothetical protein